MDRRRDLTNFLGKNIHHYQLEVVAGDASFRHYYRVIQGHTRYIVMDAPPEKEDCSHFVQVANAFSQAGVRVPEIIDSDFENGFLLLSDFGDRLLFSLLKKDNYYLQMALDELFILQSQGGQNILELPEYDQHLLLNELALFRHWFVQKWLNYSLSLDEEKRLDRLFQQLILSAENQPQVWVHRDYHSKNLLLTQHDKIGVIDFQDAVLGPITYDIVSLLKDCYILYEKDCLNHYLENYYLKLVSKQIIELDYEDFVRYFDLMGLQRHIKVLGIFTRLSIRDQKHGYLKHIILVFQYITDVLNKYDELQPYRRLFNQLKKVMLDRINL